MRLRHLHNDESGQTLVVVAICLVVIIGFLGLAIDVGYLRYLQRNLQTAADAAALAAGLEIRVCGGVQNCTAMKAAAISALSENGLVASTVASNCATTSSSGLTMTINTPVCALGTRDPNAGKRNYVEVVLSETQQTYFARVFGFNNVRITARAEAERATGPCIYALDPTGSGAISVLAGIAISTPCTVVDESSSPSALSCVIGAFITAPKINVTGGASSLLCGLSTRPTTGVPVPTPADPLAYLPKPAVGSCGTSTSSPYYGSSKAVSVLLGGNVVFNPGVYCGGISITAALLTNVTFNPGVYILTSGPGLLGITSGGLNMTVGALSTITGTGVTFYNTGTFGSISVTAPATLNLSNFSLTAPTSGTYSGVLFFQDPGNTSTGTFLASLATGSKLEGAIYLPNASVSYGVNALSSAYNILVAKDINFNVAVASTFANDYSALAAGSPIGGDDDVLVQ